MKKILLLLLFVLGGLILWRSTRQPAEPARPAPSTLPADSKPVPQALAISGSTLNKAFPQEADGYKLTFTQEKDGFSEAVLSKGGTKLATLSVSDTAANPSARDKFRSASDRIAGFPVANVGSMGTAVLAGDRYQVQVRSLVPSFTTADRAAWLARFHLAELAAIRK